ncbi:MAG TPA: hypothetical protein VHP33_18450 [Polyangiaceae bacterium]|nr:hypothetical protein [Polyangiaceae bacterium]
MLPLDLIWDAPTECPSYAEVVTELERITRVKPGREITPVRAQATIERTPSGRYRLRLLTEREGQTGETELDANSCPVLKRGVTLVLALTLGDGVDVVDEPAAPEPPPKPPEAPPVEEKPTPPPAKIPTPVREPDEALRFSPWLAASGAWGLVRKPSFGPQLGLALGKARWQARADVTFWPPVDGARYQSIDSSYLAFIGAVGACARALPSGWSLAACGTFQVGAIHGSSSGAFRDGSATAPWYAVAPSLVVTAPAPIAVRLEASLGIAFEPPRFAIQYADDVYTVSRFVPAVSIGLSW